MATNATNKEIQEAIATLNFTSGELEYEFAENGGEVTEDTELLDERKDALTHFLSTDGVDSLGRWYKAKEDEVKALKAEKDYITRKINAANGTLDYIKRQMDILMESIGVDKIKGSNGYSITRTISSTTSVDKDILNEMYAGKVQEVVQGLLPPDVTITLGASVSAVVGDVLPPYYIRTDTPTTKFTKPRAKKD